MKIVKRKLVAVLGASLLLLTAAASAVTVTNSRRRWAVRPINANRTKFGHYENLVRFMKNGDSEQFFKYTRLTPALFDHLLCIVGPSLKKHPHRIALSPEQRLTITLHYLSQGCSMQELAWNFRIGKSTAHYVVKETCNVLWHRLMPDYLGVPSAEGFQAVVDGFFKRWNMPNCVGALDGKHVSIQCPEHSGSQFFNYKKTFSLVLMATCDAYYKFTMVDIGGAGANHDATTFKTSGFGNAFLKNNIAIPPPKELPGTTMVLPHFLVADQAFPLHTNIMRPYAGNNLDESKKTFNYRLSRARRTIENTFGILVQRWRILRTTVIGKTETCEEIVKACVVLHNFVQLSEQDIPENERSYCPTGYVDHVDENGVTSLGRWRTDASELRSVSRLGANNASGRVKSNRDLLAKYFLSNAGSVQWQFQKSLAGSAPDTL